MKDNISLIAAAAGGFMLSVAIAGILRSAPVTSVQTQLSLLVTPVADLRLAPVHPDKPVSHK